MALDQSALLEVLDALKVADVGDRVRQAAETVYQALIEAELTETIGAALHERTETRTAQRNGHRSRILSTAAGDLELRIPKLRAGSCVASAASTPSPHRPASRASCSRSTATTPCSPTRASRRWPRRPPTATTPSIEQVIAELKNGPLAHLPSGRFTANAAWLACAAMAHNLTRAAATLAGGRHRRTRTTTIRAQLIHTPARIAHSAHRQILHLPRVWPYEPGLDELFRRALHDPLPTTA
jgi:hypothetical protein